ncbi:hypothetical protein ACFPXP_09805, partial [Marinicrinis lubricantis]
MSLSFKEERAAEDYTTAALFSVKAVFPRITVVAGTKRGPRTLESKEGNRMPGRTNFVYKV